MQKIKPSAVKNPPFQFGHLFGKKIYISHQYNHFITNKTSKKPLGVLAFENKIKIKIATFLFVKRTKDPG